MFVCWRIACLLVYYSMCAFCVCFVVTDCSWWVGLFCFFEVVCLLVFCLLGCLFFVVRALFALCCCVLLLVVWLVLFCIECVYLLVFCLFGCFLFVVCVVCASLLRFVVGCLTCFVCLSLFVCWRFACLVVSYPLCVFCV